MNLIMALQHFLVHLHLDSRIKDTQLHHPVDPLHSVPTLLCSIKQILHLLAPQNIQNDVVRLIVQHPLDPVENVEGDLPVLQSLLLVVLEQVVRQETFDRVLPALEAPQVRVQNLELVLRQEVQNALLAPCDLPGLLLRDGLLAPALDNLDAHQALGPEAVHERVCWDHLPLAATPLWGRFPVYKSLVLLVYGGLVVLS